MSTVHADPHWSQVKSSLKLGREELSGSYMPKDSTIQTILTNYAVLMDNILRKLREYAEDVKARASSDVVATIAYQRHSPKVIAECEAFLEKNTDGTDPKMGQALRLTGLSLQQLQEAAKKATAISRLFIDKLSVPEFSGGFKAHIQEWQDRAVLESTTHLYRNMGLTQSGAQVAWEDSDLQAFGVERSRCEQDPVKMSCVQYALLKGHEVEAKGSIFNGCSNDLLLALPAHLERWGYRRVTELDVGDIVVYFGFDRKPSHVGYYVGQGLVESKLGIASRYSHRHAIFSVPQNYGNQVVFYRKSNCQITEE